MIVEHHHHGYWGPTTYYDYDDGPSIAASGCSGDDPPRPAAPAHDAGNDHPVTFE